MYSAGEFDITKPKSILFDDNIDMTSWKYAPDVSWWECIPRYFPGSKKYLPLHEHQALYEVHDGVAWWE